MGRKRRDIAAEVLAPFRRVLAVHNVKSVGGQTGENQIAWGERRYLEFGDLRIDAGDRHIVIEVESGGGLHNLVKYWFPLASGFISRPLVLLHLFSQSSRNDFAAHIDCWEFLAQRMRKEFGSRFEPLLYRYDFHSPAGSLTEALAKFESLIRGSST